MVVPFEYFLKNGLLHVIPHAYLSIIIDAVRNRTENHVINRQGNEAKSFPLHNVFSGTIEEAVTDVPVIFPSNTPYGIDNYVIVHITNTNLYVYVPAKMAGLQQAKNLTQMIGRPVSVIIEHIVSTQEVSAKSSAPMVALGSIQSAEYEIGLVQSSLLTYLGAEYFDYIHTGIITGIDDRHGTISVAVEFNLSRQPNEYRAGYLPTTMDIHNLTHLYSWQTKPSDLDFVRIGQKIDCKITYLSHTKIDEPKLKGDLFTPWISSLDVPSTQTPDQIVQNKILTLARSKAYVHRIEEHDVIVEIAPKFFVKARISPRLLAIMHQKIDRLATKEHLEVIVQFDYHIRSVKQLKSFKGYPVTIVQINQNTPNHYMKLESGVVEMIDDKRLAQANRTRKTHPKQAKTQFIDNTEEYFAMFEKLQAKQPKTTTSAKKIIKARNTKK